MPGRRLIVVSEREHSFLDIDDLSEVRVGRAPDSDVVLKDDMVSRKHCVLEVLEDGLRVRDLKSFNGTYVNEKRIREETITTWDAVRIGRTKIFLVDRSGGVGVLGSGTSSVVETPADAQAGGQDVEATSDEAAVEAAADLASAPAEEFGATRTMSVDGAEVSEILQNREIRAVIDDLIRRQREEAEREISQRVREESAPAVLPGLPGRLRIRAKRYGPADGGGDFYDVFEGEAADQVVVALGSVSGVGIAASVAAGAARHTLRGLTSQSEPLPPLGLLERHLEVLRATLHPGSAVSLLVARVSGDGHARVACSGGTGVLHYDAASERFEVLRAPGRRDEEAPRPETFELSLKTDDRLLLLSDGAGSVREAGGGDPLGIERLQQGSERAQQDAATLKELVQGVMGQVDEYVAGSPDRDATLVAITVE